MNIKYSWRGIELQSHVSSEIISESEAYRLICALRGAIEKAKVVCEKKEK